MSSVSVLIDLFSSGYTIGDLTVTCQKWSDRSPVSSSGCTLTAMGTSGRYWLTNPNISELTGFTAYVTSWPEVRVTGEFYPIDTAVPHPGISVAVIADLGMSGLTRSDVTINSMRKRDLSVVDSGPFSLSEIDSSGVYWITNPRVTSIIGFEVIVNSWPEKYAIGLFDTSNEAVQAYGAATPAHRNTLETHVLKLIGEDTSSPDVFTDTDAGISQVRTSLNEAIAELCMMTGSYKRTTLLPLYASRMFYRLGFEDGWFGWVTELWDRDRKRRLAQTSARRLYEQDVDFLSRTGEPEEYMQIGHDILGVWRMPSATGKVLELTCVMIPKAYASEKDPIRLRHVYETAAVYLAVSDFYASRGNAGRAQEYLMRYLETAQQMGLHPSRPEQVQVAGGASGNIRN